jgi:hypothetical protein
MLGERQVAAPLMAQRAAHGALRPAHRRFQPGAGVGVQLAGLRLSGKPHRPSQCQFGHETLVLRFALIAPAASRPGQHRAVRRQRGRQVAPRSHTSTVGQRFPRLIPRDDQEERRRTSSPARAGRTPVRRVAAHVTAAVGEIPARHLGTEGDVRLSGGLRSVGPVIEPCGAYDLKMRRCRADNPAQGPARKCLRLVST